MGEWAVLTQPDCGGHSNRASAVLASEQPRRAGNKATGWTLTLFQGCESFLTRSLHRPS